MTEKIRVTVVVEYIPDLAHYPVETIEDALHFDAQENPFVDFPYTYLDDPSELKSVTYEVVSTD
jgi:hypothetical protein